MKKQYRPDNRLHCGACMTDFETTTELSQHLETCPAVQAMLSPAHKLWFTGENNAGHPLASLLNLIHKHSYTIRRYAACVANELNSLERAKIHYDLCQNLGLDYKTFKPFESEKITAIPTPEVAEKIIWEALGCELQKL